MLAHFDASGSMGDSPFFVMAGYLAPLASWQAFTREWRAALDEPTTIEYFKMREANGCDGQFRGWSADDRDQRLQLLCPIINRHVSAMVLFVVSTEAWRRHFLGKLDNRYHDRPYYFAFHGIMSVLARYLHQKNIDEKIDFVFDDEGGEPTAMIQAGYDDYVVRAPEQFKKYLGSKPRFENDKVILPLQAADMLAWHARRIFADGRGIDVYQPTVIANELMTGAERIQSVWREKEVKEASDFILGQRYNVGFNIFGGVPMTLPDPSSPLSLPVANKISP